MTPACGCCCAHSTLQLFNPTVAPHAVFLCAQALKDLDVHYDACTCLLYAHTTLLMFSSQSCCTAWRVPLRCTQALEDLYVHYDATVRNAAGGIVQFAYGDDGLDPVVMEGKDGRPLDFERLLAKVRQMRVLHVLHARQMLL
jgi:hypothetical protein